MYFIGFNLLFYCLSFLLQRDREMRMNPGGPLGMGGKLCDFDYFFDVN